MQLAPPTTSVVVRHEVFTSEEDVALAGFLAGYSGLTREAYQLDLRQYVEWCAERQITLFCARRADIEGFGRHLETLGRASATIARRLCTIACFYRYAEQEGLLAASPAGTFGVRASTTSHTPRAWIATKSAPCSSRPGSRAPATTRSSACWH